MAGERATIRAARAEDAAALAELQRRYWAFEGIAPREVAEHRALFERFLAQPALGLALLAEGRAGPLGYIIGCAQYSFEFGGMAATLDELFIDEAARGQGIGGRLLDALIAQLRAAGCVALDLEVDPGNAPALALYASRGLAPRTKYTTLVRELGQHEVS